MGSPVPMVDVMPKHVWNMEPNWFLGIEPNAFGAIGAMVNFIVAYIVSKKNDPPPKEIKEMVERIRLP